MNFYQRNWQWYFKNILIIKQYLCFRVILHITLFLAPYRLWANIDYTQNSHDLYVVIPNCNFIILIFNSQVSVSWTVCVCNKYISQLILFNVILQWEPGAVIGAECAGQECWWCPRWRWRCTVLLRVRFLQSCRVLVNISHYWLTFKNAKPKVQWLGHYKYFN